MTASRSSEAQTGHGAALAVVGALALLTVADGRLYVVVDERGAEDGLPRFQPRDDVPLDALARHLACDVTECSSLYLEQLYTFSVPDGQDGSSITVSYLALLPQRNALSNALAWRPLSEADARLPAGDRSILDYAVLRLQAKIGYTTIAFHLMPAEFTLSDLQATYETILGRPLDKRNFRRQMLSSGLISRTDAMRRSGSHRPAALYQFAAGHDPVAFLTPATA